MPPRRSSSSRTLVLHRRVRIEVTPLPFVPLESVKSLDLEALSRAKSALVEVGHYETGCCRRLVRAIVRDGTVTAFELEPCKERAPMTPEMKAIVAAAHQAARKRDGRGPKLPVRVAELPRALARIKVSLWTCIKICCFGHCLVCCIDIESESPRPVWASCAIDGFPKAR